MVLYCRIRFAVRFDRREIFCVRYAALIIILVGLFGQHRFAGVLRRVAKAYHLGQIGRARPPLCVIGAIRIHIIEVNARAANIKAVRIHPHQFRRGFECVDISLQRLLLFFICKLRAGRNFRLAFM